MFLDRLTIHGYRGFSRIGSLDFAIPNGAEGSGLTILTGPNNSGKSCILECLRARSGNQSPSFTTGTRNSAIEAVEIAYIAGGRAEYLRSISKGSSETIRVTPHKGMNIFVLPSRRTFNPYFGRAMDWSRPDYVGYSALPAQRSASLSNFEYRLFKILKAPDQFNELLEQVLGAKISWTIDQSDQGSYFLKFFNGNGSHSSDGLGDGIISVFSIVDSLYDSSPGDIIAIDEPELSLHPSLQKRLSQLLTKFASDRQIVIATHSPYFIGARALYSGARLARIITSNGETTIFQLSDESKNAIVKLSERNIYNPHTFGLDARELFFQEDRIILTEGQEDVLLYPAVADQVGATISGHFFGWGVGGASNIAHLSRILRDLGFKKVAGLLDGDKIHEAAELKKEFPEFFFACIPAKDIRTKPARNSVEGVDGLMDDKLLVKAQFHKPLADLFIELNRALDA